MGAPAATVTSSVSAASQTTIVETETEWEYEYSTEKEDYYFTLDITTHSSSSGNALIAPPSAQKARKRGAKQTAKPPNDLPNASHDSDVSERRLQVLDLASENPLLLFDRQLYSCHWSTDLGTQVYVARAGTTEAPVRPGYVVDLVGTSRARLVSRKAVARPRSNLSGAGVSAENAVQIEDAEENEEVTGATSALPSTPKPVDAFTQAYAQAKTPEARAQIEFLSQLQAIKKRKGETDTIPLHGGKKYRLPENWQVIRKEALAADAETARRAAAGSESQQPGSTHTLTPATRNEGPQKRKARELDVNAENNVDVEGAEEVEMDSIGIYESPAAPSLSDIAHGDTATSLDQEATDGGLESPGQRYPP